MRYLLNLFTSFVRSSPPTRLRTATIAIQMGLLMFCLSSSGVTNTYFTKFAFPEAPIDERGQWLNDRVIATDWSNVTIYASALASGNGGHDTSDSAAILSGAPWGPDQYAAVMLWRDPNLGATNFPEAEILLRATNYSHGFKAYEFLFSVTTQEHCFIGRWNGPGNNFTSLLDCGLHVPANGDILSATCIGNPPVLTMFINGVSIGSVTDNDTGGTHLAGGNPGIGFDSNITTYDYTKFGFRSFYATDDQSHPHAVINGWMTPPNWRNIIGIRGGFPRYPVGTNVVGLDGTGAADSSVTLNAIMAAKKGTYTAVVVPNGTFKCLTNVLLQPGVELRGSGTNSIFRLFKRMTTEFSTPGLGRIQVNLSANAFKGDASVGVVSDQTANLASGCMLLVNELNNTHFVNPDGWQVECGPYTCTYCDQWNSGTRVRGQFVLVTNVTSTTIGFTPPLFSNFQTTNTARVEFYAWPGFGTNNTCNGSLVTDLTIDNNDGLIDDNLIRFEYAMNCGVSNVNLHMSGVDEAIGIQLDETMNDEVRHNYFVGHGINSWGFNFYVDCGLSIFEDNIGYKMTFLAGEIGLTCGNAFTYNFNILHTTKAGMDGSGFQNNDFLYHGAHPDFTLFEGNYMAKLCLEEIHGSSSFTGVYRNWVLERQTNTDSGAFAIQIDATNWWASPVGNIVGFPGMKTNDLNWRYQFTSDGSAPSIPGLICPTNNPPFKGPSANMVDFMYSLSGNNMHSADPHSQDTGLQDWNYNYASNRMVFTTNSTGTGTYPDSILYASKPVIWNGYPLSWPSVYSASNAPTQITNYNQFNPAGYRYDFGDPLNPPPPGLIIFGQSVMGKGFTQ